MAEVLKSYTKKSECRTSCLLKKFCGNCFPCNIRDLLAARCLLSKAHGYREEVEIIWPYHSTDDSKCPPKNRRLYDHLLSLASIAEVLVNICRYCEPIEFWQKAYYSDTQLSGEVSLPWETNNTNKFYFYWSPSYASQCFWLCSFSNCEAIRNWDNRYDGRRSTVHKTQYTASRTTRKEMEAGETSLQASTLMHIRFGCKCRPLVV